MSVWIEKGHSVMQRKENHLKVKMEVKAVLPKPRGHGKSLETLRAGRTKEHFTQNVAVE